MTNALLYPLIGVVLALFVVPFFKAKTIRMDIFFILSDHCRIFIDPCCDGFNRKRCYYYSSFIPYFGESSTEAGCLKRLVYHYHQYGFPGRKFLWTGIPWTLS